MEILASRFARSDVVGVVDRVSFPRKSRTPTLRRGPQLGEHGVVSDVQRREFTSFEFRDCRNQVVAKADHCARLRTGTNHFGRPPRDPLVDRKSSQKGKEPSDLSTLPRANSSCHFDDTHDACSEGTCRPPGLQHPVSRLALTSDTRDKYVGVGEASGMSPVGHSDHS